jgi:hypothetical protein
MRALLRPQVILMPKLAVPARRKPSRSESVGTVTHEPLPSADVAAYLADMAIQLAGMATEARLDRLGYLLTLAALEAQLAQGK